MKHSHRPVDGSQRGIGAGIPAPDCAKQSRGKACCVSGAHVTVQCRCGAIGTICPDHARIHWIKKEARS